MCEALHCSSTGLWHPSRIMARFWAVLSYWRRIFCVWRTLIQSTRSNTNRRMRCVTVSHSTWLITRLSSSAVWARWHVSDLSLNLVSHTQLSRMLKVDVCFSMCFLCSHTPQYLLVKYIWAEAHYGHTSGAVGLFLHAC